MLVFIARRTLDAELALDLTAETFAQAFRGRRSLPGHDGDGGARVAVHDRAAPDLALPPARRGRAAGAGERSARRVPVAHEDDLREIEERGRRSATLRAALGDELERLQRRPARGAAAARRRGAPVPGGRRRARRSPSRRRGHACRAGCGRWRARWSRGWRRGTGMSARARGSSTSSGEELVRARAARPEARERAARGGSARAACRARCVHRPASRCSAAAAAVAVAASLVIGRGDPIPPRAARARCRPSCGRSPGTARLNGARRRPTRTAGPPWDVRTSRSKTGAICATVGQVLDGELGLVGLDRRFRALPAGAADTCSTPQRRGATLAGARAFRGGGRLSDDHGRQRRRRAAACGAAVAVGGGRTVALKLGPAGAFLAIFRRHARAAAPARGADRGRAARARTLRFADTGEYLAARPERRRAVDAHADRSGRPAGGLRCVAGARERGPDSPTAAAASGSRASAAPAPVRSRRAAGRATRVRSALSASCPSSTSRAGAATYWGLQPRAHDRLGHGAAHGTRS